MSECFRPEAILVTGSAGFIGSNLVLRLLESLTAARIVSLDDLTYAASLENLRPVKDHPRHTFIKGNICDAALVKAVFETQAIDAVMHLAAESHVDRSIEGPAAFVQTNVVGTYTLLEAARQYWKDRRDVRFLHVSTDEVYGSLGPDDSPFTELTPYAPNSPYSASKAASDHLVRAYFRTFGLPTIVTNCSNNYGPRQHREKFLPTVIASCAALRPIPVYGNGKNVRDWLYVDDHCRALWLALSVGRIGETYSIGGNRECANIEMARTICALFDARRPEHAPHERLIEFVTDRLGHDWRYAIDPTKAVRELGWRAEVALDDGLDRTLDWYLDAKWVAG